VGPKASKTILTCLRFSFTTLLIKRIKYCSKNNSEQIKLHALFVENILSEHRHKVIINAGVDS